MDVVADEGEVRNLAVIASEEIEILVVEGPYVVATDFGQGTSPGLGVVKPLAQQLSAFGLYLLLDLLVAVEAELAGLGFHDFSSGEVVGRGVELGAVQAGGISRSVFHQQGQIVPHGESSATPGEDGQVTVGQCLRFGSDRSQNRERLAVGDKVVAATKIDDVALHVVGAPLCTQALDQPLARRFEIHRTAGLETKDVVAQGRLYGFGVELPYRHGGQRHSQLLVELAGFDPADPAAGAIAILDVLDGVGVNQ